MNDPITPRATAVSEKKDADVLVLSGSIDDDSFRKLLNYCRMRTRKNVLLVLVTNGGDPHAGYKIARMLQRTYENFTVLIAGPCKSAGTLVALGAREIVIADTGELGPLDIQLLSREHLGERDSGNDMTYGITHLGIDAMGQFFECFKTLASSLETKIAAEAASKLVGRLYGRVFDSVHPRHIGSVVRANQLGSEYAKRLMSPSRNPNIDKAIHRLVYTYPEHGFVIDREEAASFLPGVRAPDSLEQDLVDTLRCQEVTSNTYVFRLAPELPNATEKEEDARDEDAADTAADAEPTPAGPAAGPAPPPGRGPGDGGGSAIAGDARPGATDGPVGEPADDGPPVTN